ncbi:MAG: hypothetical protein M3137_14755 [Actinomycetota bacterium]|nr:hypothetical protein [Actinomycetota bacterium]
MTDSAFHEVRGQHAGAARLPSKQTDGHQGDKLTQPVPGHVEADRPFLDGVLQTVELPVSSTV